MNKGFKKGIIPWNKGKKGVYSPETLAKMKDAKIGRKLSDETKKKMGLSHLGNTNNLGKKFGESTKQKQRDNMFKRKEKYGYINSPETREKIRLANLGKKTSEETKNKIKIANSKPNPKNAGENSGSWLGDDVKYNGLHTWIRRNFGKPLKCFNCGIDGQEINGRWTIEYANRSGKYLRDRYDWLTLCRKCHRAYDLGKIDLN